VAAKHGIVGLTKVCALENATSGVTCNAICPGWVLTPLVQKQVDAKAAALGRPTRRPSACCRPRPSLQFTTPEELGALAVFLCSPAADNVRGVAWTVDERLGGAVAARTGPATPPPAPPSPRPSPTGPIFLGRLGFRRVHAIQFPTPDAWRGGCPGAHGGVREASRGAWRNHGAVHIANGIALVAHQARGLAQKRQGIRTLEGGVGIRKMRANAPSHAGSTEHGVCDGVKQRVGVRCPQQALGKGYVHPAQNQGPPLHQRVRVPALHRCGCGGQARQCSLGASGYAGWRIACANAKSCG
jgi:hypothetical protein